jgi:DNA-binding response OmpR family regulator
VKKSKILVIVGDSELRGCFCDALNSEGFLVKDVSHTKEALKYLSETYDLPLAILLYIVGSGAEESTFLDVVKSHRSYMRVPIIVHSLNPLDSPHPYLELKHPFDLGDLINMIETCNS